MMHLKITYGDPVVVRKDADQSRLPRDLPSYCYEEPGTVVNTGRYDASVRWRKGAWYQRKFHYDDLQFARLPERCEQKEEEQGLEVDIERRIAGLHTEKLSLEKDVRELPAHDERRRKALSQYLLVDARITELHWVLDRARTHKQPVTVNSH